MSGNEPSVEGADGTDRPGTGRLDRVRLLYRWFAPIYDAFRVQWGRWTREAERELDGLFSERIGAGTRILELAPGTGVNLERLQRCAPEFASYLGIDASPDMLEHARRKAGDDPRIELRLGDVRDLSGAAGPYDFVVSTWLLSHLDEPEAVVRAAVEGLAPGGTAAFLFTTRPRSAWVRLPLEWIFRVGSAQYLDPERLRPLPCFERLATHAGGLATLAVFRRPKP